MSAQQTFALCLDCWEMHYGIADSNGVYTRDSGSSNHFDHAVHVFRSADQYAPPIRNVLSSLHAGLPITDARMEMFSLACAVTGIEPNNSIKVAPVTDPRANDYRPDVAEKVAAKVKALVPDELDIFGGTS